jgi:cytochrome c oxidase subunit 2
MTLAIVIVLLIIGSILFHFLSPWYFTPIASNWSAIDDTMELTFWVTGAVFAAVNLFLAYAIFKYRYQADRRAAYEPENKKLEIWLSCFTAVGVAAMLAPGLFVWSDFVNVPKEAHSFEVVGQQWHWSFRYPGKDGKLGTVDPRLINLDNPFGINPDDPTGQDDVLINSNVVHVPLDKPVRAWLRSKDVLHNFTVPQFRVKMDLVPGIVSFLWFTPTRTGTFDIMCEELCGIGHHVMRGKVVVDEEEDFQTWLDSYPTYAQLQAMPPPDPVAGAATFTLCATCHGAKGEGNLDQHGPKLSGQEPWYLKRQLEYYKQGVRGTHADDAYGKLMAPMAATLFNEQAIDNVIAYIQTLPDDPAPATVKGNVEKGEKTYRLCAYCHGPKGDGRWALNAPRQAGMSDWYLVTQLKNFKHDIRGNHSGDLYGSQMSAMAKTLSSDEIINNLVAYINTLPMPEPEPEQVANVIHAATNGTTE